MRKLLALSLTCLALLTGSNAFAENVSGTYVSNYPDTAVILQIVQSQGNQLQGRAEQVSLASGGQKIDTSNFAVTGAVSGGTIILNLKPAEFMSGIIPMSGTVSRSGVQISGGSGNQSFTWILARSDQSNFDRQVSSLTARANGYAMAAAAAAEGEKRKKAAEEWTQSVIDVAKHLDSYCGYVSQVEIRLQKIRSAFRLQTQKMRSALEKERVTSNQPGDFKRNQVAFAIGDMLYLSQDIGYSLDNIERAAHFAKNTISTKDVMSVEDNKVIGSMGCGNGVDEPCVSADKAWVRMNDCNNQLIAQFKKTELVRHQEMETQKQIKQEADQLAKLN